MARGWRGLVATGVLALAGCGGGDVRGPAPIPHFEIAAQVVLAPTPAIGSAADLAARGRYLWVSDMSSVPFVHVVDIATGQPLVSFGRHGEGPGDFHQPPWFLPHPSRPDGVMMYDPGLQRLTAVSLDGDGLPVTDRVIAIRRTPQPRRLHRFQKGYLGWFGEPDARWVLLDEDGGQRSIVPGPLVGDSTIPFRERIKASSNLMVCSRPAGTRFAVLYTAAGRIELHDSTGAFLGLADVPDSTNGHFIERRDVGMRWDSDFYYYHGCAATDHYLFALYAGHPEGRTGQAYAANQVQVYDWNGRQQALITLSTDVLSLTVDRDATTFYGVGADHRTIYRFDIPVEFQGAGP